MRSSLLFHQFWDVLQFISRHDGMDLERRERRIILTFLQEVKGVLLW